MQKIIIIIFLLSTLIVKSQNIKSDNKLTTALENKIDTSVLEFFENGKRVGLSIGIYDGGKESYYNYGSTQSGKQSLPTKNAVYEIGSISKTFTGTLLANTIIEGKANGDDDVRKYIDKKYGDYPNLENNHSPIKLKYLVSHVSGLPAFLPDKPELFNNPNYETLPFQITDIQNSYSKVQFFQDLKMVTLDTVPGYKFKYSNAGAQLLQFSLEKIHNKTFEELLNIYITKPLGMKRTTSFLPNVLPWELVSGYNEKGTLMPYNPHNLASAGGIFSSSSDMIKYLKFHLNEKNKVVQLSHKEVVGTLPKYATGLNWQEIQTQGNIKKIWQSGGTFGFGSYCVMYPNQRIAIILLSNESDQNTQSDLENIAVKIFGTINK